MTAIIQKGEDKPFAHFNHEDMVCYIQKQGKTGVADRALPILDQLRGDLLRVPIKISCSFQDQRITVFEDPNTGIPLHVLENLPERLNTEMLNGELLVGGFAICTNDRGEMLFIQKTRGKFWYVPGGLAENNDKGLNETAKREVEEEAGIVISTNDRPCFAYESIPGGEKPRRHNLMIFYMASCSGDQQLKSEPDEEICDRAWIMPAKMRADLMAKTKISLPSIQNIFDYYIASEKELWNSEMMTKYNDFVSRLPVDKTLFDLCLIELIHSNPEMMASTSLFNEAVNRSLQYLAN